jgi:hypothetical protein
MCVSGLRILSVEVSLPSMSMYTMSCKGMLNMDVPRPLRYKEIKRYAFQV